MQLIEDPTVQNAFDSLAEMYATSGDTVNALKNYQQSIKLNAANSNAIQQLKKLQFR